MLLLVLFCLHRLLFGAEVYQETLSCIFMLDEWIGLGLGIGVKQDDDFLTRPESEMHKLCSFATTRVLLAVHGLRRIFVIFFLHRSAISSSSLFADM